MFGNLLRDPLVRVTCTAGATRRYSLPQVLAALSAGDGMLGFPGLAPHQVQAWHCFLVQLAALACLEAGREATAPLPASDEDWARLLRALTPGYPNDEPWCLAVPEVTRPAFLQPPSPQDDLSSFSGPIPRPDELDLLVTTRNHDIKAARAGRSEPDHWVFTLVSMQTLSGYSGRGNYGIVRANGGYASRPLVTFAPGPGWGARFRRDLAALLHLRISILAEHPFTGRHRLLWLAPWDGDTSLPVSELDPYAIEVARRVRLAAADGTLVAFRKPTSRGRVAGEDLKGNVGDPWIPIRRADGAALNLSQAGFHYRLVHELLFSGEYRPAPCQTPVPGDPEEGFLWCFGLAREQRGTAGLHERWVPIPRQIRRHLLLTAARDSLATVSRGRIDDAGAVSKGILRPALLALAQGAPADLNFRDRRVDPFLALFDRLVDRDFFDRLWAEWELPDPERRARWGGHLSGLARALLRRAEQSLPVPLARRYPAAARAWLILEGGFRKHFPELEPQQPHQEVEP